MSWFFASLMALQAPVQVQAPPAPPIRTARELQVITAAARDGDKSAQLELGIRYETGDGVRSDRKKAIYWLKRASRDEVDSNYVYSGAVGKESHGRAIEVGRPRLRPGLVIAAQYLAQIEQNEASQQMGARWSSGAPGHGEIDGRPPLQYTAGVRALLAAGHIGYDQIADIKSSGVAAQVELAKVRGKLQVNDIQCDGLRGASVACGEVRLSFLADIPVSNCVDIDRVGRYLTEQNWKRLPDPGVADSPESVQSSRFLPSIENVFIDANGALLKVSPNLKASCVTKIELLNLTGRGN